MAQDVLIAPREQRALADERPMAGQGGTPPDLAFRGDTPRWRPLSIRLKAHICLGVMASGFLLLEILMWAGVLRGGWFRLLATAFEAGTVGAMADWFAVTALFREVRVPFLRLPLPLVTRHSNIIIRNRPRITQSIVHTIQNQWLTPEAIRLHLTNRAPVDRVLEYFNTPEKVKSILEQVRIQFIAPQVGDLDQQQVVSFLAREIHNQVQCLHLAQPLGKWTKQAVEKGDLDRIWDELQGGNAFRLLEGIFRYYVKQSLLKFASRLEEGDPAATRQFEEQWKGIVGSNRFHDMLVHGMGKFVHGLVEQTHTADSRFMQEVQSFLVHELDDLRTNMQKRQQLNEWAVDELTKLITNQRPVIGGIVHTALTKPDNAEWCSQLEEKVGDDLQWIRINGAIVGMMVGLILGGVKIILAR